MLRACKGNKGSTGAGWSAVGSSQNTNCLYTATHQLLNPGRGWLLKPAACMFNIWSLTCASLPALYTTSSSHYLLFTLPPLHTTCSPFQRYLAEAGATPNSMHVVYINTSLLTKVCNGILV